MFSDLAEGQRDGEEPRKGNLIKCNIVKAELTILSSCTEHKEGHIRQITTTHLSSDKQMRLGCVWLEFYFRRSLSTSMTFQSDAVYNKNHQGPTKHQLRSQSRQNELPALSSLSSSILLDELSGLNSSLWKMPR